MHNGMDNFSKEPARKARGVYRETSQLTSTADIHLDTISKNHRYRLNLEGVGQLVDDWLHLLAPLRQTDGLLSPA